MVQWFLTEWSYVTWKGYHNDKFFARLMTALFLYKFHVKKDGFITRLIWVMPIFHTFIRYMVYDSLHMQKM